MSGQTLVEMVECYRFMKEFQETVKDKLHSDTQKQVLPMQILSSDTQIEFCQCRFSVMIHKLSSANADSQ